jgi:phosphoenolpyruvate-protein phosphotransferase (PTS system enzyme I)
LFMNRRVLPDEEEQYDAYVSAVQAMQGKPVTIRTIDIGSDKPLQAGHNNEEVNAPNPALGLRAIRYSLAQPQMFRIQLRALLRAALVGRVQILVPMVAHANEIQQLSAQLAQARAELAARSPEYARIPHVPIGAMIEIPAAALTLPLFVKSFDFLSLGTNDLIQYTLAIDRADESVAHLYDPLHPAVLRLIADTIAAGARAGKPVSLCGEMAGETRYTKLLLAMGLRSFSMHPSEVARVKSEVLHCDAAKLGELWEQYRQHDIQAALQALLPNK